MSIFRFPKVDCEKKYKNTFKALIYIEKNYDYDYVIKTNININVIIKKKVKYIINSFVLRFDIQLNILLILFILFSVSNSIFEIV